MISWMQKHKKYLVITIWISTIAFVGAGFVGWGAYKFGNASNEVAQVGDISITYKELEQKYSQLYNYYNQLLQGKLDEQKAKEFGLQKQALLALIQEALLENFAKKHDLSVSDEEVAQKIASIPAFWQNGQFSKELYLKVLENNHLRTKDFEEGIKKEILLQKVAILLEPKLFDTEFHTMASALFMGDKIEYKPIHSDTIKVELDEKKLQNYFKQHKENYFTSTKYHLALIEIPTQNIRISEDELKSFYQKNRFHYKDKDGKILPFTKTKPLVERDAKLKKAKREALKTYILFKKGKVKSQKEIIVSSNNVPQAIALQLKNASKGKTFKPIVQDEKYVIYKLLQVENPRPMSFAEAKELVKKDFIKEEKEKFLEKKAKDELPHFHGIVTDYITRIDVEKLKTLPKAEAAIFLKKLFTSRMKKGFIKVSQKTIILYNILDQKLKMPKKIEKNKKLIKANGLQLKTEIQQGNLIKKLEKLYTIKIYKGL